MYLFVITVLLSYRFDRKFSDFKYGYLFAAFGIGKSHYGNDHFFPWPDPLPDWQGYRIPERKGHSSWLPGFLKRVHKGQRD